jgi:TgpA N-terminal domain/Transglutaminase-like superfamily
VTPNARMTVTAAIAVVLASTVLYPLFTDSVFLAVSMGAVIAVAGTGALTRLRSLPVPVCVLATLIGLLLYLNLIFEARHSWAFVIPTPGSISRLWQLGGTGLNDANRYAPPAPNLAGLLLLAAAGVGITAVATDLIAVRLHSTALAGLPLLVLFTVPVMMNAPHSEITTPLVFCAGGAGYLAMLSADGRERIRVWGHLVSLWRPSSRRDGESRSGPDTRMLAAAGRRVGLASIVLALCAPLLIPGLHPSKVFSSGPGIGGDGGGSSGALILPAALSGTIAQLHENPLVMFTYRTSASKDLLSNDAPYFRQYAFDTLGDTGWAVSAYAQDPVPSTSMPRVPGLSDMSATTPLRTSISVTKNFPDVGNNQPTFLPMPYPATQVQVAGRWLADSDLMVYSTVSAIGGQSYSVSSDVVDPSQGQLERVPALAKTPALDADTQLPPSYQSAALKKLAQTHVAGATTEFAKVNDLAIWLSQPPYVYSISTSTFDNAAGLLSFLTTTRVGYCVQYAYAMTVLTRLLGIPARFVVGYTAGTPVKSGSSSYEVKNTDAHAWTEVYFPTFGWIRFEPTPGGQGTANSPNYMGSSASGTGTRLGSDPIISATGGAAPKTPGGPTNRFNNGHPGAGATGGDAALSGKSAGTPWAAVVLAVIAAIVLASGVISMVAPPAQRILSAHPAEVGRRRRPAGSVILVTAAAALFALALYRLLSHTSRLNLGAGWATVGIAFGAAGAAVLIAPSLIRVVFRRWRWMRATDDVSRAHAAWREFHDDLADFGIRSRSSEPPRTLAGRVTAGLPETAGEAVRRLALAEERARYAARPAESRNLRRDGVAARRGLAAAASRGSRWRANLFPASLLTALADGAARLPDQFGAARTRRAARKAAS